MDWLFGKLETTVAVSGHIDVQVRNELDALRTSLAENRAAVQPTIDEWRRVKLMGHGVVWTVGIAGAAFGRRLGGSGIRSLPESGLCFAFPNGGVRPRPCRGSA